MGSSFHVPRKPEVDDDGTSFAPAARGIGGAVKNIARFDVVMDEVLVGEVGQSAGDIHKNVASVMETAFELSRSWSGGETPVGRGEIVRVLVFDNQSQETGVEGEQVGNARL